MVSERDRQHLRALAAQVRDIASLPEMEQRRQRWRKHNALRGDRPLVLCFPEGAWEELLPDAQLHCADPLLRSWEKALRMRLYWWQHIHDDAAIDLGFDVQPVFSVGDYGFEVPYTHGEQRGSYVWQAPMTDLDRDFDRLHFRPLSYDHEDTERRLDLARDILGDLLPVRRRGWLWWTVGLTWEVAKLIGLEQLMLAMCDQPAQLHRLMAWMRDEHLHFIQWFQDQGLLVPMNDDCYVGSGGLGYTEELPQTDWRPGLPARLSDRWGFAESQETVGISPAMFEEFVLPYQLPLLERFGLNCYGCCEGLQLRLDAILKNVPRLRRVSVAPTADQEVMAEKLAGRRIFSRKPNPVLICTSFNEQAIRADLRRTLAIAGQGPLELIMKDTHTVRNEPQRITRWVQIALEEVDRYVSAGAAAV